MNIVADCDDFHKGMHEKAWFWLFIVILPILLCAFVAWKKYKARGKGASTKVASTAPQNEDLASTQKGLLHKDEEGSIQMENAEKPAQAPAPKPQGKLPPIEGANAGSAYPSLE